VAIVVCGRHCPSPASTTLVCIKHAVKTLDLHR